MSVRSTTYSIMLHIARPANSELDTRFTRCNEDPTAYSALRCRLLEFGIGQSRRYTPDLDRLSQHVHEGQRRMFGTRTRFVTVTCDE